MARYVKDNYPKTHFQSILPKRSKGTPEHLDGVTFLRHPESRKKRMLYQPIVIGIAGLAGSGKDTIANLISELTTDRPTITYAFSDPVKDTAVAATGLDPYHFSPNNPNREIVLPEWGYSPRQMLQIIGTNLFRDNFKEDIWIQRAKTIYNLEANKIRCPKYFIIPSVRFKNEAEWVLNSNTHNGIIIHVTRPSSLIPTLRSTPQNHPSEQPNIDNYIDYHINNDSTFLILKAKVEEVLEDFNPAQPTQPTTTY